MKMVVAVDLDDVISDLISELIRLHHEETGRLLRREEVRRWDMFSAAVQERVRCHGYARLDLLPGARPFLAWVHARHDTHIVTYRNDAARAVTHAWLQRHVSGLYQSVHFAGGSKVALCRELSADVLIDDSYNQVPAVTSELGIPAILMDTPMNRHLSDGALVRRARTYREATDILDELDARHAAGSAVV